jgi:protein BCP1
MPKRKQDADSEDADSSTETSDVDLIDVAFEFFDPNPKIDYQAIKRLLSQLFQHDSENLDMHELTELILSQPTVGTTIKTDGIESDPYALMTVLNMHLHHKNVAMRAVANYLLAIASKHDPNLHSTLEALFSQSESHVGLVLCERLRNMPVQVIPPMYRMLADEVRWAVADQEPYTFTHIIILSRVYHLSEEEELALANSALTRPTASGSGNSPKRARKMKQVDSRTTTERPQDGIYSFHPEDVILSKYASHCLTYPYQAPPPSLVEEQRTRESFGLDIRGRIFLIEGGGEKLREVGESMAKLFGTG